jgi:hypothetical protein
MSLKLRKIKQGMKQGGKTKPAKYTPPRFLYRDANEYTALPIVPKTLDLVPKKLKSEVSDLDFRGVIKSEFPTRKKPKGSKSKDVGPSYLTTIKFEGVSFSDTKDKIHTEELEFKGKKLYFKKPSLAKNSAKIRCQCADFRHKFETPIAKSGSLAYGTARPYIRKTPEWTLGNIKKWEDDKTGDVKKPYPYANPTDKLGYCKHIHSFLAYLMDDAKLVKQS